MFLAVLNTECLEKYFRHFKMLKKRTNRFLCLKGECFHSQLNAKKKTVGEGAGWKSSGKMLKHVPQISFFVQTRRMFAFRIENSFDRSIGGAAWKSGPGQATSTATNSWLHLQNFPRNTMLGSAPKLILWKYKSRPRDANISCSF